MQDETPTPPTQPFGALVPPPHVPPGAVALASPAPLPEGRRPTPRSYRDVEGFRKLLVQTFDTVDRVADTIAEGLGLR